MLATLKSNALFRFISYAGEKELINAMNSLGFKKNGKSFVSDKTNLFVEFPPGPISVGDELLKDFNEIKENDYVLKLFTPTQSIMDRLSAFYFWDDQQSLDQAILIAKKQPFSINRVKKWSEKEGELEKYKLFESKLKDEK